MADEEPPDEPRDKATELLTKLARVPKEEIDAREREYQKQREARPPARPREIIPPSK